MPTKKKKTTARKPAPKKAAPAKSTKPAANKKAVKRSHPVGPREQKLADSALKLVDQAASILRQGIHTSADSTEKARLEAKQKAHTLLTKASSSLSDLLSGSTSTLRSVLNKI